MEEIKKKAECFKNLVLKYNLTLNDRIMLDFESRMDELKQCEKDIYTRYITHIDKKL